jgi:hypothetical protein
MKFVSDLQVSGFLPLGRYILYTLCTGRLIGDLMGTIGKLFRLTDSTNGIAVDQVQQQHLFISKLHIFALGKYLYYLSYIYHIYIIIKMISTYCCTHDTLIEVS